MNEIDFIEVDELDLRLGLTDLLSDNYGLDTETNSLINSIIHETKMRAMKDALKSYRNNAFNMSQKELIEEKHRSKRLGQYMNTVGYNKLSKDFEAHAIVSGKHFRAIAAREILAQFNIRIDDPTNGIWLPNFNKNLNKYKQYTTAHRSVHKKTYYFK